MASLLLGPILRHIGEIDATVWVEADSARDVEIPGRRERTFRVNDRDYAIPTIEGLEPSRAARTSTKLFQGRPGVDADSFYAAQEKRPECSYFPL